MTSRKSSVSHASATIKCSFLNQIIIYQSFYSALLTFTVFIFNFREKFCVSARVGEMSVLKTLSKKIISLVLFDIIIWHYFWAVL